MGRGWVGMLLDGGSGGWVLWFIFCMAEGRILISRDGKVVVE